MRSARGTAFPASFGIAPPSPPPNYTTHVAPDLQRPKNLTVSTDNCDAIRIYRRPVRALGGATSRLPGLTATSCGRYVI